MNRKVLISALLVLVSGAYFGTSFAQKDTGTHKKHSSKKGSLSNDRRYTNSRRQSVHSPARTSDGAIPEGATAVCRDGTYSFSMSHRGTCSHHGGVKRWLR